MKILSFGSLNLDKVYSVNHFIRPGETMAAISVSRQGAAPSIPLREEVLNAKF